VPRPSNHHQQKVIKLLTSLIRPSFLTFRPFVTPGITSLLMFLFVTDDGKAIKAAKFFKVPFIITPKIVVELFRLQKISFSKARESLEKLGKIGRYSPEIIADALVSLMEEKNGKTDNHKNT